ncbi:MAG: RagB/SusD family nutrient uptake outer membrane protein, partial [Bacteroidota bacterium]
MGSTRATTILLFLVIFSCGDILEEVPRDRTTVNNFFQTPANLDEAVTATYKQLVFDTWNRGIGGARYRPIFCGADDWTTQPGGNKGDFKEGDQLNINSSNENISAAGWNLPYDVILQANFSIFGKEELQSKGFSEEELNPKIAEVYFLRAWAYFTLVRLYGGVPIVLKAQNGPGDFLVPRSSVEDVYQLVLDDLTFAIEHLPEEQVERARVNRWAAKSLRSSVYLTMAGWPLKQDDKYTLALQDAQDVIQNGPYSLENEFGNMFLKANEDTNTEYIWQLKFCGGTDCPGQGLNTPFASQATKPQELGGFEDLFIEIAFFNKFPEGSRKDFTFLSYLLTNELDTLSWQNFTWQHPFLSKFYDGAVDKTQPYLSQVGSTAPNADLDFPMLRLAEIMLIYAEA